MFERFTEKARAAVVAAGEQMQMRGGTCATTIDMLVALGLLEEGVAPLVLSGLGVDVGAVREADLTQAEAGEQSEFMDVPQGGHVPFTKSATGAMDKALRTALSMGHTYVGTEHLLLGLVTRASDEQEGSSARAWVETNVEGGAEAVREAVVRHLTVRASRAEEAEERVTQLAAESSRLYRAVLNVDGVAMQLRSEAEVLTEANAVMRRHVGTDWDGAERLATIAMAKRQAADAIERVLREAEVER